MDFHLLGIHARSRTHVSASRDSDRARISSVDYRSLQEKEALSLAGAQASLGAAFVSDGQFLWHDLLRPFAESRGFSIGPLTRWFETNTFYKKPSASAGWAENFDPSFLRGYFFQSCKPALAFLPGPHSLSRLSEGVEIADAALALEKSLAFLKTMGFKRAVLSEPGIGYEGKAIGESAWKEIYAAYSQTARAGIETVIHVYFGPCPKEVFSLEAGGIAVDLFEDQDLSGFPKGKILGLGAVDASNTLLETEAEIEEKARNALNRAGNPDAFLCPNMAFDYVPRQSADDKLARLARAAGALK